MRKIREVLRLSALGLAQHQIARSCSIVQSTVHKYMKLAQAAKLAWPLPEDLSDRKLDELLFGRRTAPPSRRIHPPPDFAAAHKELQNHKDLTLELLWQEYKQADPGGYGYSRFCDLYREWSRAQKFTLRQQHNPGEKLFVDYAGATIAIHNRDTGEVDQAAIFVAAMGFSSYTFAEATWSQQLPCWIGSHIRGSRGCSRSSWRSTSAPRSPGASGWRRASTSRCRPTTAASFGTTWSLRCAGRRPSSLRATPCCSTASHRTTAKPTEAMAAGGCSSPATHRPPSTTRASTTTPRARRRTRRRRHRSAVGSLPGR